MKKYPLKLFIAGVIMNFIKNLWLVIIAVICLVCGIWSRTSLLIGMTALFADIVFAVAEQLLIVKEVKESDNPQFKPFNDAFLSEDWEEKLKELIEEREGGKKQEKPEAKEEKAENPEEKDGK